MKTLQKIQIATILLIVFAEILSPLIVFCFLFCFVLETKKWAFNVFIFFDSFDLVKYSFVGHFVEVHKLMAIERCDTLNTKMEACCRYRL